MCGRGGGCQDWGLVDGGAGGLRQVRGVKQKFRVRVMVMAVCEISAVRVMIMGF